MVRSPDASCWGLAVLHAVTGCGGGGRPGGAGHRGESGAAASWQATAPAARRRRQRLHRVARPFRLQRPRGTASQEGTCCASTAARARSTGTESNACCAQTLELLQRICDEYGVKKVLELLQRICKECGVAVTGTGGTTASMYRGMKHLPPVPRDGRAFGETEAALVLSVPTELHCAHARRRLIAALWVAVPRLYLAESTLAHKPLPQGRAACARRGASQLVPTAEWLPPRSLGCLFVAWVSHRSPRAPAGAGAGRAALARL
eukprot:scaffold589_cov343-Prasinococcus_capsulatus_cf.AAC.4